MTPLGADAWEPPSDQVLVDAKVVELLAASGYAKPGVERLNASLARHGMQVVPGLIITGRMYIRARERNPRIKKLEPPEPPLPWETCQEIATFVVAKAGRRFEQDAIRGGGWSPEGGATLATHFINMCIDAFPNEFRSWRRANARNAVCLAVSPEDIEVLVLLNPGLEHDMGLSSDRSVDPRLKRLLAGLGARARLVIGQRLAGYSNAEIAQQIGTTPGAVASAYHRAVKRLVQLSKEKRS